MIKRKPPQSFGRLWGFLMYKQHRTFRYFQYIFHVIFCKLFYSSQSTSSCFKKASVLSLVVDHARCVLFFHICVLLTILGLSHDLYIGMTYLCRLLWIRFSASKVNSNHSILRPFLDLILLIFKLLKIKLSSLIIGVKTCWLICVISFSSNLVKLLVNELIAQRNTYIVKGFL